MPDKRRSPSWTSPYRLVVAARLLRVRGINIISVCGIALGIACILLLLSVMDGYRIKLREVLRGTLSDVIVEVYVPDPSLEEDVIASVGKVEGVEAVSYQMQTVGLVLPEFLPTRIVGIDPETERRVSAFFDYLLEPVAFNEDPFALPGGGSGVILSKRIADQLGVSTGDSISLRIFDQSEDDDGKLRWGAADHNVSVARLYSSQNTEFDRLHVYVDRDMSRKRFFLSDEATVKELRVKLTEDGLSGDDTLENIWEGVRVSNDTGRRSRPLRIDTWESRQIFLLRAISNQKAVLSIVMLFIVLVGCFCILATLTMTVAEKRREIGVLRALGATRGGILSIFLLNGALVGCVGAGAGYLGGIFLVGRINTVREFLLEQFDWDIFPEEIYLFPYIPTHIDHANIAPYAVGAALAAVLFAAPPALWAAIMPPVRAFRAE